MLRKPVIALSLALAISPASAFAVSNKDAAKAFNSADRNSDNALNRAEFESFLRRMAKLGNPNAARAVQFGFVGFRIAFADADANGDGKVTSRELQKIR